MSAPTPLAPPTAAVPSPPQPAARAKSRRKLMRQTELVERDRDKNPVVALREIAAKELKPEEVKEEYIKSLQKHAEVDEPEEARPDTDDAREDPAFRQVTEEELLRALTSEAQRRAEPQPEEPADYEE